MNTRTPRNVAAAIAAAAAGLALTACGAETVPPPSEQDRTVSVTTYEGTSSFQAYLLKEIGFFDKHDIEIEEVAMPAGPQATNAFLSGSIDVHYLDVTAIFPLLSKGEEIELISGAAGMYWSIIGGKDLAAKDWPESITQLRGEKVAVAVKGSVSEHIIRNTAIAAGMEPDEIDMVATGGFPQSMAAIETGQVAAAALEPLSTAAMTSQGYPSLFSYADPQQSPDTYPAEITEILEHPEINYLATTSWTEQNPDTVKDFQAALEEGIAYIRDPANFDEVVGILRESNFNVPSLDDQQFEALVQGQLDIYDAGYSTEAAEGWISFAERVGISGAESVPSPTEWISPSLLGAEK